MEIFHYSLFCNLVGASIMLMMFISVSALDFYSEALLSLKSEIIDEHNALSDWSVPSGEIPPGKTVVCSWSGVTCDRNSTTVVALNLSGKRLRGPISGEKLKAFADLGDLNISHNSFSGELPPGIFNLTRLSRLDISRNNFSGRFPPGISNLRRLAVLDAFSNSFSGPLPEDVSRLDGLRVLNFAGSYFDGPIPPEYGSLKSLEFFHLAGNSLGGNIPPELGKLRTVTHMEIGYNSYQGSIPRQLGNMSELRYLDIAGANLSGSIPKELSNLTNLETLFLFRNRLAGEIPPEFGRISRLESLDLSDNLISGKIPESFSELKSLRLLSLMCNAMTGSVPEGIAELPFLETLVIWSNGFGGTLPVGLGRNSRLEWLDASTNALAGAVPPEICSNGELRKVILFSNEFSGGLSPALSNCSSLVRLRLENNSFSGEISLRLGDLGYVDLSRNNFTGGIPADLSKAVKLQYFNVSHNPNLGGAVPPGALTSPVLRNFSASSCGVSGDLPPFRGCDSVAVIELSTNGLTGALPESISGCRSLERIDLSNNRLSGHIPDEVARLPRLAFVDLSRNGFAGSVPAGFSLSSSLKFLDVSGNPKLCGEPLPKCSSFGSRRTGRLVWIVLLSASVAVLAALLVVAAVYLRRATERRWKVMTFGGLPRFTAKDVLRSFRSSESACKAVLPTGVTVSMKKVDIGASGAVDLLGFAARIGDARHKNLARLLGVCYGESAAFLLYEYFPNGTLAERLGALRDWPTKHRIAIGVARGLRFLHHECSPAIAHGDLRTSNIVLDEYMEPNLAEFGIKHLLELNHSFSAADSRTGESEVASKESLFHADIYSFGEILLEILSNGRLANSGAIVRNKPMEVLLTEFLGENEVGSTRDEIRLVLDVALLCTVSRPTNRPSMDDVLKLLSGSQSQRKVN